LTTFYSQNGEDQGLARLFGAAPGLCVEVGAHDGIDLSNSYYFEQRGWTCILVEPNPELCAQIRKHRPGARLFECACSRTAGQAVLFTGRGPQSMFSTLETAEWPVGGRDSIEISVTVRTLDSILEEAGVQEIDFVSIDIEGHELQALQGFSLDRWRPRIVILEDNSDLRDRAVADFMRAAGYLRFYRTGVNDWYARPGESRWPLLRKLVSEPGFVKWVLKGNAPGWLLRPALAVYRSVFPYRAA